MKAETFKYKKTAAGFGTLSAAIVEVRRLHAVALAEDGCFVRIRNEGYEVGQSVELREEKPAAARNRVLAYASMAAVLLLFIVGGYKSYTAPYGLVSLDVNPSIEYTINIFDRVIGVRAVNADGETILNQIESDALLYRSVGDAVDATITQLQQNGYLLEAEDNYVVLSTSANGETHAQKLAETLQVRVNERAALMVQSFAVSGGEVTRAHEIGTSAGKLRLIDQLKAVSDDPEAFDESEWIDEPVRDLIRAYQSQSDNKGKATGESSGNAGGDTGVPSDNSNASENGLENGTGNSEEHNSGKDSSSSGGTKKPRNAMSPNYLKERAS
ncbi:MAG TPA: hypothetical protein P5075_09885 [Eubacteriales bacterium]|nr:hypothetical protein [Eubacteriales bacterium]